MFGQLSRTWLAHKTARSICGRRTVAMRKVVGIVVALALLAPFRAAVNSCSSSAMRRHVNVRLSIIAGVRARLCFRLRAPGAPDEERLSAISAANSKLTPLPSRTVPLAGTPAYANFDSWPVTRITLPSQSVSNGGGNSGGCRPL